MQNFKIRFAKLTVTATALVLMTLTTNARLSYAQEPAPVTIPITQKPNVLDKYVYLPLTAKPLPVTSLSNGDFEGGATGWTEHSSTGVYPRIRATLAPGVTPRNGSYALWLGGVKNDTSYGQQQVSVSSGSTVLAYWHWIASNDVCNFDKAHILVNGAVVETYNLCDDTGTSGWVQHTVNLSAFVGQSVLLRIQVTTDGSLNSNLFIDDMAFQASPTVALAQSQQAAQQVVAGGIPLHTAQSSDAAPMPEASEANTPINNHAGK